MPSRTPRNRQPGALHSHGRHVPSRPRQARTGLHLDPHVAVGSQRGVVQTRGRVLTGDPPEGLRRSRADAPQKFEQVDGGAEPAVAVDQGPEEQGPDRDHQAGQAVPQPRHRAAAGPAALARQPERARAAARQGPPAVAGSARASPGPGDGAGAASPVTPGPPARPRRAPGCRPRSRAPPDGIPVASPRPGGGPGQGPGAGRDPSSPEKGEGRHPIF